MIGTLLLDSQAIQHLEILEVERITKHTREGSLIDYMDKTVTSFGKRELERWICSPLTDPEKINDRLDCIEDLTNHSTLMANFRTKLKTIPDLEKQLSNIYKYSIKQSVQAISFENLSVKKIREFHEILEHFKGLKSLIGIYKKVKDTFKSKRLRSLLSFKEIEEYVESDEDGAENQNNDKENENEETGLFPNINQLVYDFDSMIVWKSDGKEKIPEPTPGIDDTFDAANQEVARIRKELDHDLEEVKEYFQSDEVTYVHSRIVSLYFIFIFILEI